MEQPLNIQELKNLSEKVPVLLREYNEHKGWQSASDKTINMSHMSIDGCMASRGQTVVNYPIEDIINFLTSEGVFLKLNPDCLIDRD